MRLRDLLERQSRPLMVRADGARLVRGALRLEDAGDGWSRPWRFTEAQERALGSCQAWHPGLFRQMARATAGVRLEFETDSSEIAVEVMLDGESAGTRAVLDDADAFQGSVRLWDGVSADVDGRHLDARLPRGGDDYLTFSLDDPASLPAEGLQRLPGFSGQTHHVRVWLPALRGCAIRDVIGNGTRISATDGRPQLLVLGDSIAQGFCSGDPALAWPSLLADALGLDLVNQGIGGQVFQPGSLADAARHMTPERIVVELGENYRYEPCREAQAERDAKACLDEVARAWPEAPVWVLTPMWHDESRYPSHAGNCFQRVPAILEEAAGAHEQMILVDGARLLDADPRLLADGYEHPDAAGSRQIAERLALVMSLGQGTERSRSDAALDALEEAPIRAFPLAEAIRRGDCDIVCARPGCVLARAADGDQLLWASDHDLGRLAISTLMEPRLTTCLEPALVRDVRDRLGLADIQPFHLAIYQEKEPPLCHRGDARKERDPLEGRDIRPLDASFAGFVRERYAHPEYLMEWEIEDLLARGLVLGAFDGGECVGFIAEHPEGSMGMLEVLEGHRRQGWGAALEAAKISQVLARGEIPWCSVFAGNRASLRLQRSLGLKVTPSNEQCWLSAAPPPAGAPAVESLR